MLTRLVSSWRQAKVRSDSAGSFEARRIINGGFEGQRSYWTNTRNCHHSQTDFVTPSRMFYPSIQIEELPIYLEPGIQQRQHGVRQDSVGFDQRAHYVIETTMLDSLGQAQPKDLQEPPNLVRQIDCLVEQGLAATQQRANTMRFPALHVNRAEPAGSQDMSNAAGIVLIGLVPHRRQSGADLAGFHAGDIKAIVRKTVEQMLTHGASLKPDPCNRVRETLQTLGDFIDVTGQFTLKSNATPRVHNAQSARSQRHIQPGKKFHRLSPLLTDFL